MIADPLRLIDVLAQRGVQLAVTAGGELDVTGPAPLVRALLPQLARRKTELVETIDALDRAAAHRIAARARRSTVRGAE
jgi:hypothetical protein